MTSDYFKMAHSFMMKLERQAQLSIHELSCQFTSSVSDRSRHAAKWNLFVISQMKVEPLTSSVAFRQRMVTLQGLAGHR